MTSKVSSELYAIQISGHPVSFLHLPTSDRHPHCSFLLLSSRRVPAKYALQTFCYSRCSHLRCPLPFIGLSRPTDYSQVRGVVAPTNDLVLSASRDSTAISWQRSSSSSSFAPESVLRAGSRYVNAVAYIPPSVQNSKGNSLLALSEAIC